jgi:hypothetical protein
MRLLLDFVRPCKAESFYGFGEFYDVFELGVVVSPGVARVGPSYVACIVSFSRQNRLF